jgi:putative tricarboxylic transport membrane protein
MKTSFVQKRKAYLAVGGIGLLLAAGYLGMAIQLPFGQLDQPGAGVFPIVIGALLMLASLATVGEGWRMERTEQVELPGGEDRKRLLSLIALLFGYFLALPWLGQIISSTLFCVLLVRLLSELTWWRVVAYSLLMSIAVYAVFVYLLKVPMPRGILIF